MYRSVLFRICLVVLLLGDTAYTFDQHLHLPLDGDLAAGVVETPEIKKILHDPFALKVLLHNERYANPNRFFSHWALSSYFRTVPQGLQLLVSPIDSVYIASALAITLIQLGFVFLIVVLATGSLKIYSTANLLAAVCVAPFFQVMGYGHYMAVIDHSVTYNFFYSFPLFMLILFFAPFFRSNTFSFSVPVNCMLFVLCIVLPFSGPLIPGISVIVCSMALIAQFRKHYRSVQEHSVQASFSRTIQRIPFSMKFYFGFVFFASIYSLYIGLNNSIQLECNVSLLDRYTAMPTGLFNILTVKLGFPLLLGMVLLNIVYIRKKINVPEGEKISRWFYWFVLFAVIYILLLPLGGYRPYRPFTLRYDTIMPVTVTLIFMYVWSAGFILKQTRPKAKMFFVTVYFGVAVIYTMADGYPGNQNAGERQALQVLAQAPESIVCLSDSCTVLCWGRMNDYRDSEVNAQFLKLMGITSTVKYYFQPIGKTANIPQLTRMK